MTIQITDGPSLLDPLGIAPIHVLGALPGNRRVVVLTARTWRVRLAIWLLRAYVNTAIASAK
jgi:hypothetical protein